MRDAATIVVVGGGLAGGLTACRLAAVRPDVDVLLLERASRLGGEGSREHTWSFHETDLEGLADAGWVKTFATRRWDGYDVSFPALERTVAAPYASIRSRDFHARATALLGERVALGVRVRAVEPGRVTLDDGRTVAARLVVDARGFDAPEARRAASPCAFQKFYGLFARTERPHGLTRPVLMDATVEQLDGFRFVYALPWSETELLVEDTRYSDGPALDEEAMRGELERWLARRAPQAGAVRVEGDERGVLPIPFHGVHELEAEPDGIVRAGVAAGLFHPTTGYSLPDAARFAELLAAQKDPASLDAQRVLRARAAERWRAGAFFRRLNNMFFRAAAPAERRGVMQQFYRRDCGLIARFYQGELSRLDRLRLLSGRPPVPVGRGLRAFFERIAVG